LPALCWPCLAQPALLTRRPRRRRRSTPHHPLLNPVKIRLHHTFINHSWRFKNKADAMAFKLAWGGQ
jgi:hypothetical protein